MAGQILLIFEVLVGCDQDLVIFISAPLEQFAVLQLRPSAFIGGMDRVSGLIAPRRYGRALIK